MIRLGSKVRDKVSGFEGIVQGETRWLTGCLRYLVQGKVGADGKIPELVGFDEHILKVIETPEETQIHPVGISLEIELDATARSRSEGADPGGPIPVVAQR